MRKNLFDPDEFVAFVMVLFVTIFMITTIFNSVFGIIAKVIR